jgi:NAD(P)-dependent dehydrogenase (short-subunit alcohol dehydrogenase family)
MNAVCLSESSVNCLAIGLRSETIAFYALKEVAIAYWVKFGEFCFEKWTSAYFLLHLGIPELQARGKGCIVAIGLIAAYRGFPGHAPYCASKGALVSLIRQIALDYSPTVRANILCPGPVDTPMLRASAEAFPNPSKAISKIRNEARFEE